MIEIQPENVIIIMRWTIFLTASLFRLKQL